jgi:hypothetical protein
LLTRALCFTTATAAICRDSDNRDVPRSHICLDLGGSVVIKHVHGQVEEEIMEGTERGEVRGE